MSSYKTKLVISILEEKFPGFTCNPRRMLWTKEADAETMLLIGFQGSRTGSVFYLNFGVYFPGIVRAKGLPKLTDWHLTTRFERFETLSVEEYNQLFSLEDIDEYSLRGRCERIAEITKSKILPGLLQFGDFDKMKGKFVTNGSESYEPYRPYWPQNICMEQISKFILNY